MLRVKLQSLEEYGVIANKSVLQTEKERNKFQTQLELIEVQLQGKRVSTHDDTDDGHDMYTEVDEWDLRDFNRETTVCKTVGTCHSGLSTINRRLEQSRTGSCFTPVLVWLVGLHTATMGTLL